MLNVVQTPPEILQLFGSVWLQFTVKVNVLKVLTASPFETVARNVSVKKTLITYKI